MLPADANNNFVQVLQPVPGTLQRLAPTTGNASLSVAFSARAVVVGLRVRSVSGIGHVQFGDATAVATVADMSLTVDDGWMYLSPIGKTAGGVGFKAGYVSIFAETATVNVDIVEFH